jgi:hypothetical protein
VTARHATCWPAFKRSVNDGSKGAKTGWGNGGRASHKYNTPSSSTTSATWVQVEPKSMDKKRLLWKSKRSPDSNGIDANRTIRCVQGRVCSTWIPRSRLIMVAMAKVATIAKLGPIFVLVNHFFLQTRWAHSDSQKKRWLTTKRKKRKSMDQSNFQRVELPLRIYLRTAPHRINYLDAFNDPVTPIFSNAEHQEINLKSLLEYLATFRLQHTRRLPTAEHLVVEIGMANEKRYLPWGVFFAEYVKCSAISGLLPLHAFNLAVAFEIPAPVHECNICCEEFTENFKSPCRHNICGGCWKRILMNFYNHPVTKVMPYMHCPFESCKERIKCKHFKPLLDKSEYKQLRQHIKKMREPDLISVDCVQCKKVCTAPVNLHYNQIQIPITCQDCNKTMCYDCSHEVSQCICSSLPACMLATAPGCINRMYRSRPRNKYLTAEGCANEIAKLLLHHHDQPLVMECPKCACKIVKSTECNEMEHCGVKWCYLCGEMTSPTETFLCDHFGDRGGCPRYEHPDFWRQLGASEYKCRENRCYTESCACTREDHAVGRKQQYVVHRMMWLRNYLRHTPRSIRGDVLRILNDNGFESFVVQLMFREQ